MLGPTGTGKTTLIRALLQRRYDAGGAVAVLATKSHDDNLTRWAREDHLKIIDAWPAPRRWWVRPPDVATPAGLIPWEHRVMVWPRPIDVPLAQIDDVQLAVLRAAITDMFWARNWCIVGEELRELADLGLKRELVKVWTQGRSAGLSLIGGSQRPRFIPLEAYSQASHLFMFADPDRANLDRLQELGGMNGDRLAELVVTLPAHDVLYVDARARRVIRTRAPYRKGAT